MLGKVPPYGDAIGGLARQVSESHEVDSIELKDLSSGLDCRAQDHKYFDVCV